MATLIGTDIIGENINDRTGQSVAISADGQVLIVGSTQTEAASGYAAIYNLTNNQWVAETIISGGHNGCNFGWATSMSDNGAIVAVSEPWEDDMGDYAGRVRVFWRNGAAWERVGGSIYADSGFEEFGYSVSLSADGLIVAIGAPMFDGNTGYVDVYQLDSDNLDTGNWARRGSGWLVGESGYSRDNGRFGESVSLSADGELLAVGCPGGYNGTGGGASQTGFAQVFRWSGTDYVRNGDLIVGVDQTSFGNRVCFSRDGSTLAIADYSQSASIVRTFRWNSSDEYWQQLAADVSTGEPERLLSSVSLAANGEVLAFGVPGLVGFVRVFDLVNGTQWRQRGTDFAGETPGDNFGQSVHLSADGTVLAIGAPQSNPGTGYARVFSVPATVPCFHGSVLLPTVVGVIPAARVRVGTILLAGDGTPRVVRHVTSASNARCVHIAPGALGVHVPSAPVIVTPNHLLQLPSGRILRADQAMSLFPKISWVPQPLTVYHIGVDDWTFVRAHNLLLETLAWKPEHHEHRPNTTAASRK